MPYKDPGKNRQRNKTYYQKNKKRIAERVKKYRFENSEKVKKQQKIYNKRHQKKRNKNEREKRKNNPKYRQRKNEYGRLWRQKNPEKQAHYKKKSILKNQYGLTLEEYQKMVNQNNGACHICDKVKPGTNCRNGLCVDHNHKTGKNRGLLCHSCNRGIGLLGDTVKKLERAVKYLKKYEI